VRRAVLGGHAIPPRRRWWTVAAVLAAPLLAAGCGGGTAAEEPADQPAVVQQEKGTDVQRVILKASAAQRLGIELTTVRSAGSGTHRTVIPYSAVLYDPTGDTWTYTSPKSLVFVRQDITIDSIDGDSAILARGPPVGARIVSVGSTEIWGVEYGGIEED
jgi:hypothetical protein